MRIIKNVKSDEKKIWNDENIKIGNLNMQRKRIIKTNWENDMENCEKKKRARNKNSLDEAGMFRIFIAYFESVVRERKKSTLNRKMCSFFHLVRILSRTFDLISCSFFCSTLYVCGATHDKFDFSFISLYIFHYISTTTVECVQNRKTNFFSSSPSLARTVLRYEHIHSHRREKKLFIWTQSPGKMKHSK